MYVFDCKTEQETEINYMEDAVVVIEHTSYL